MEGITNSERGTAACAHRWLLRYGLGLRPVAYARPLYLGSLVHSGLEALFSGWDTIAALDAVDTAAERELAERGPEALGWQSPYCDPATLDALRDDTATARALVRNYAAQWASARGDWEILRNEFAFSEAIRLPDNPKRRSKYRVAGKVDKVARVNGRIWIIEHKTSAGSLAEWAEKNRRNPQGLTYAVALAEHYPEGVAGVIYDLINSRPPKPAEALAILKSGKALAKVAGLPWTTAAEFERAIGALAEAGADPLDGAEWYRDTLDALRERDAAGFWFRREAVPFEPYQVARVNAELYHSAEQIGAWRKTVEKAAGEGGQLAPEAIPAFLASRGHLWPREASLCYQFNRLCPYASICATGSAEDLAAFAITGAAGGHDELATDNGAEGRH